MDLERPPEVRRTGLAVVLVAALLASTSPAVGANQSPDEAWFSITPKRVGITTPGVATRAKNIILFLGDGMSISTVVAARILEGQLHGQSGEENFLSFERFPYVAFSKTYANDSQVNDSAATMSAIVTGLKGNMGTLSMNANAVPGRWQTGLGNAVPTILEIAETWGLSTGVVSTARLTHASPAACYSHSVDRNWEADSNLPADAKAAGVKDIARQLIEFPYGNGLEVALSGGRAQFRPRESADPEYSSQKGARADQRDLTRAWQDQGTGWKYVWNQAQFDAIDPATTDHLLGLFEPAYMHHEADRARDAAGEPSLSQMTSKAIDVLKKNPRGFFLMVEGGLIDSAHHANNAYRALTDTIELAHAVTVAIQQTNPFETLIVVTADHGHVLSIAGYPARGNPILGKVKGRGTTELSKDAYGLPYTTLVYGNGPGYRSPRQNLTFVNTEQPDYQQDAAVPLGSDTHSGEDMPVYASGAGAQNFHGVMEQNWLFDRMMMALSEWWLK